jgi:hypothetical protein
MVTQSGLRGAKMKSATRRPIPCLPDQISRQNCQKCGFRRNFDDLREELISAARIYAELYPVYTVVIRSYTAFLRSYAFFICHLPDKFLQ